ncbi:MAG: hypothetical protein Q9M35_10785 [Rhodothermus sp.]|nr:hypothetical protein [Rhodothermus sp.]
MYFELLDSGPKGRFSSQGIREEHGRWWLLVMIIGALLCGCGVEKPAALRAELVLVDTIRLAEPDTLFLGEFLTVTVTLNPFRLYVPDRRLHRVVVYDSLGRPLQVIGRPGFDEPGTLRRPFYVLVHGDRLYIDEAQGRFALFRRDGRFIRWLYLPEGYGATGRGALYTLDASHLIVGSVAYAEPCASWFEPACEGTRVFSVVDTSLGRVTGRFGVYPALYQEKVVPGRWAMLDVLPREQRAAAVYELSPEVHFYRVYREGGELLGRVPLFHAQWRPLTEAIAPTLSREAMQAMALQVSHVRGVYFVGDTLVLAHFQNLRPEYFVGAGIDPMAVEAYGVLVSLSGMWQQALRLPGPVLGRDEAFHLYIRLSDEPGRRLIGRYRVVLKQ